MVIKKMHHCSWWNHTQVSLLWLFVADWTKINNLSYVI